MTKEKLQPLVGSWHVPHEFVSNPSYMAMEAILVSIARRLFPDERENFQKLEDFTEITLRLPTESTAMVMPIINYLLQHCEGHVSLHVIHLFNFDNFRRDSVGTIINSFPSDRAELSLKTIGDRADRHQLVVSQMIDSPNCRYDTRKPMIWDIARHLAKGDSIVTQLDAQGLKDPDHRVGDKSMMRYACIVTGLDIDADGKGFVYVNLPGASASPQSPDAEYPPVESLQIEIGRFMELWDMDKGQSMPFYALGRIVV